MLTTDMCLQLEHVPPHRVSRFLTSLIPSLTSDRLVDTMKAAVVEECTPECFPPSSTRLTVWAHIE